jgi:predicted N-acetyltransferase YhbS
MEIRALRESDDRSTFRSGSPDLDRYLQRFAAQNQFRHFLGVTYVAVDEGRILGFATVAPAHIEIEDLPAATRARLPHYPLPVLRLARLAVDMEVQRQGLGSEILRFVLQLASRMAGDLGCIGVVVDSKPEAEAFYARYGFSLIETLEGQSGARPQPRTMFLGMGAIKAASGRTLKRS